MKTPNEFDYDLWTAQDERGKTHYLVRVKQTGEITEVTHDVMKFLRSTEKQMRRSINAIPDSGSILPLDSSLNDERSSWCADGYSGVIEMETRITEQEFRLTLTPEQLNTYISCVINGESEKEYGDRFGKTIQSVSKTIVRIREKAKTFFC